jgi:hypothetical protein
VAVREKSNDTIEAQIGQYFWIPSLFEAYQEDDPEGTCVYETKPCRWNQELEKFDRCYACISISKTFWKHGQIGLTICDGTHTRGTAFKHIVLITVTFDGNNQLVVLSFAIVPAENSDNWVWFKELLDKDFPGRTVWTSDADKGITSDSFSMSMSQDEEPFILSRCAKNLAENCKENCTGVRMNEEHKKMIIQLAKARTEEQFQNRLEALKEVDENWSTWLSEKKRTICYSILS